ncbi:amidohydrolase family protein [Flindersiella endophytica]
MSTDPQILRGITVWDGVNDVGPANLSWTGDRIEEVTPAPQDRHQDLAVIPGLVDTHVLLGGPCGGGVPADAYPYVTSREEQVLHVAANARQAMRRGITTLREMSGDGRQLAVRNAFNAGLMVGPRMLVYGMVGMTGTKGVPGQRTADGQDDCRKLVRTYAGDGMDGIRINTSGGGLPVEGRKAWRNHTLEEIATIVDESHALGMPVVAHADNEAGIEVALQEGVDAIEHGTLITLEQADHAADAGVPIAPALLADDWSARDGADAGWEVRARARTLVAKRDKRLRMAREAGVAFVLGTGSDGQRMPYGSALAELARHRDVLGLTDAKALTAGTSAAADAVGHGASLGRVAPGFAADFIVVKGRPWKNILLLREENILAVVCRGQVVAGGLPM